MPPKSASSADAGVTKNARRASKSRTGCQTCKVKRLKCDESKPACQNCIKRGLACPGYKQVLRWSTKYEAAQPETLPQKSVHPSIAYQFTTLDPSSFEEGGFSKGNERSSSLDSTNDRNAGGQVADELPKNATNEQDTLLPKTTHRNGCVSETDVNPDWPIDSYDIHDTRETSVVPFRTSPQSSSQTPLHAEHEEKADYELERTAKPRSRSSSMTEWQALLRSYYRMGNPVVSRSLQTEASGLVEHYFRDVCVLFSSFDSVMNPFRTVIGRLWDNSSSIYFAIQSMAAAHLANYMPNMRVTGLNMQRKAYECLQQELQLASINQTMDDKLLLAVMLLGLTACWHDTNDLGAAHLTAARALIHPRLMREKSQPGTDANRNDQFFAEALIYWEMCMAFVSQDKFIPGMQRRLDGHSYDQRDRHGPPARKVFPHPWTGIAPRAQMLFAEVGRLVRHYCSVRYTFFDINGPGIADIDAIFTAARDLEEELLTIRVPSVDTLVDVQDERTPKTDFVNIAEATKCAALLEIYRTFPEILGCRLGASTRTFSPSTVFDFRSSYTASSDPGHVAWLTSLATHILDLLGNIPRSSGTRPLQLILLVTSAAELRLLTPVASSPGLTASTGHDLEVARARGFAMTRLHELASRLPSKPVFQIIELLGEVWRRNDAGEDVFWIDVMTSNGWETLMG